MKVAVEGEEGGEARRWGTEEPPWTREEEEVRAGGSQGL